MVTNVSDLMKRFFMMFFEVLSRILRFVMKVSQNMDDQSWLQKIYESGKAGKAYRKIFSILNMGMTIYTFTADGTLIPTSSLMDYESKTMSTFAPGPGDIVVDIGAYVGRYTLKAIESIGDTGMVIAIEPEPNAYRVLLRNLKLNGAKNVCPINIALSNYDGTCKLYFHGRPGLGSVVNKTDEAIVVPCRTLDSLLEELGVKRVNWVKVDAEGAEYKILQGMINTLQKNKRIKCIFEIHSKSKHLESQLENMDFRISYTDSTHILASRPNRAHH